MSRSVLASAAALMLFVAGCGGESEPPSAGQEKLGGPGERSPSGEEAEPRSAIKVDGRAQDWRDVPVLLELPAEKPRETNYDCQAVQVTRDERNLYVLFTLGLGIGERHAQQMEQEGRATSGAIGHLYLTSDGATFSLWIPTGARSSYDMETDEVTNEPTVSVEVSRAKEGDAGWETVFEADSAEQPQSVAFAGKHLELAIPLTVLGISADAPIEAKLEEM